MEKPPQATKRPPKRKDDKPTLHTTVVALIVTVLVIFGIGWGCSHKKEESKRPEVDSVMDSICPAYDTLPIPTTVNPEEEHPAATQQTVNTYNEEDEFASKPESYNCGYDNGFDDGEGDAMDGNFHGSNYNDDLPSSRYDGEQYRLGYEEGYDDGFRQGKIDRDDEEDDEVEDYW